MTKMARRRVCLLSIDPWVGGVESFHPFNYSIRKIQAALVGMDVDVEVLDFYSADVESVVAQVEARDPDIIGASTYVWSLPVFHAVAKRLKATRPERLIVFGGPSARPVMLSLEPFRDGTDFIDALVLGEGEGAIREIVSMPRLDRASLRAIPGLAVASDGRSWEKTTERPRTEDLDGVASPYALGLVPRARTAHLETYRGCPFTCTFCEWGVLGSVSPIFSQDYLVRELEAIRASGAIGAFSIDAALNLNPRAFRNLKAAVEQTSLFREIDFHCELYPSHVTDEHLDFLRAMRQVEVGIGLQSFDPVVLEGVDRPFDPEKFDRVFARIAQVSNPTLLIIMGLPGDNPESFKRTLDRCRTYNCSVHVYHCLVLPDALMSRAPPKFNMRFDPISLKMRSCLGWSEDDFARTWGHVGELVARDGGECIPMYYAQLRGGRRHGADPQRKANEGRRELRVEAQRFGGFAASDLVAEQSSVGEAKGPGALVSVDRLKGTLR
jgi:radical SAM superfamily enzyme YgiQ (UPF0313 family)